MSEPDKVMGLTIEQIDQLIWLHYRLTGRDPSLGVEAGPLPIENAHFLMTAERDMLAEQVKVLREGLLYYAPLRGESIYWLDHHRFTYLETPAIEALAKADEIARKK